MNHSICVRRLASFAVTASFTLALPALADAQDAPPTIIYIERPADVSDELDLTPWQASELESIQAEGGWAKGLYIASTIGLAAAVPPAIIAALYFMDCSGCMEAFVFTGISAAVGGIGAVLLGVAIGLDIDSDNRREALFGSLRARVSLGLGGVLVSGTF